MRPRSASEWRSFWHHGGERELEALLREIWAPLREAPEELAGTPAERIALLLGSSAPVHALAAELGRIRSDLGRDPEPDADRAAAEKVDAWFRTRSR